MSFATKNNQRLNQIINQNNPNHPTDEYSINPSEYPPLPENMPMIYQLSN